MRSTRLRRRRRSWNIVVALVLAAAAAVLSGCDAALQPDGAGAGQPAGDKIVRSFTWRGSGDQVFFLNPGGEALGRTLHTVRLGNDSAEVYVIATAGAEEAEPQVEIVDLTGAAASRVGTAALRPQPRLPSEPAPEPAWKKDLDDAARRLLHRSAPRLPSAAPWPQRAVVPGSRETLRNPSDRSGNFDSIPATARAVVTDGTITAVVWVADREWACGEGCVTQPLVDLLAARFSVPVRPTTSTTGSPRSSGTRGGRTAKRSSFRRKPPARFTSCCSTSTVTASPARATVASRASFQACTLSAGQATRPWPKARTNG